ncbi:MAG: GntR family transcriptional regulator [Lentisphaerae bacterium]|nr:GntR family transcriptional regulator [Lentisphaerota bacterium]
MKKTTRKGDRATPSQDTIVHALLNEMESGILLPGGRTPSQAKLAKRFGVSLVTAQLAVSRLQRDGFIVTRPRSGTYVAKRLPFKSNYALVFWNDPANPVQWSKYYAALADAARELDGHEGRRLQTFFNVNRRVDSEDHATLLELVRARRLAGMVFANMPYDLAGSPLVENGGLPRVAFVSVQTHPHIQAVWFDYEMWIRKALDFLAEQGRRKVAILSSGLYAADNAHLTALLERHGMISPPYWRQVAQPMVKDAVRNAVWLLLRGAPAERPDALIIADDNYLDDSIAGLIASEMRVPQDVKVVALCNFPARQKPVLPMRQLGFDIRGALSTCVEIIAGIRRGATMPDLTLLPALWEDELAAQAETALAGSIPDLSRANRLPNMTPQS